LQAEGEKWADIWQTKYAEEEGDVPAIPSGLPARSWPLRRSTPDELRALGLSFRKGSAASFDGFRMSHLAMLSSESLECLSDMHQCMDIHGIMPSQCRFTSRSKQRGCKLTQGFLSRAELLLWMLAGFFYHLGAVRSDEAFCPKPEGDQLVRVQEMQANGWEDVDHMQFCFEGEIFIDGSRMEMTPAGTARAGWAAVQIDECGNPVKRAFGPVWSPMAQTSPSAEWAALVMGAGYLFRAAALLGEESRHRQVLHSDCKLVGKLGARECAIPLSMLGRGSSCWRIVRAT